MRVIGEFRGTDREFERSAARGRQALNYSMDVQNKGPAVVYHYCDCSRGAGCVLRACVQSRALLPGKPEEIHA